MTSDLSAPRAAIAATLVAVLTVILVACSGAGSSPSAGAPSLSPSAPPASPSVVTLDDLLTTPADHEGQIVTVKGTLIASETEAELCDIVMESYPPQCGPSIRLEGLVPEGVVDQLDQTTEPDLAQAMWGFVEITGTFDADGANGPTLTIDTISVVPAG